jgi:hypothetical protein
MYSRYCHSGEAFRFFCHVKLGRAKTAFPVSAPNPSQSGRRVPEQRVEVISVPVGGATYEHRARVAETRYAQAVPHAGDSRSVLRLLSDDGITAELTRAK